MPLTKCPDCGREVSTVAPACPQCGRPFLPLPLLQPPATSGTPAPPPQVIIHQVRQKPATSGCAWAALVLFIIVGGIVALAMFSLSRNPLPLTATAAPAAPLVSEAEKARQPARWELIQKLISKGVFTKVECRAGGLPKLYVGRAFYLLPIDDKKTFVHAVWSYYVTENADSNIVVLRDGYSGKDVGKYDADLGLRLD